MSNNLTRDEWRPAFEDAAARIRPWVAYGIDANGDEYAYVTENAPGPLAKRFHALRMQGIAEGWLIEKEHA